jgi:hypothetical protein
MQFEVAQKIADAVLYEGYLLYPYRRSAAKNQARWQFGVLVPRSYSEDSGSEPWSLQTECLVEPGKAPVLGFKVRFLQLQARSVEQALDAQGSRFRPVENLQVDGKELSSWDEAIERDVAQEGVELGEVISREREFSVRVPGGRDVELVRGSDGQIKGRLVRERWPLDGIIRVAAEAMGSATKIRVRVENLTGWPQESKPDRPIALRRSLIAAHTLLSIRDGAFVSLIDPPEWARLAAAACVNLQAWPVLVGDKGRRDMMLSAPIILYDYPAVAAESPGDLFDLTEIDELLTLRTMTLTEDEKREVRGTDACAAAILDRVDSLPDETFARLHGKVRYFQDAADNQERLDSVAWWDSAAGQSISPETDHVLIHGVPISKGSRVVLKPGCRPADAQDMFFRGRTATVEAVFSDLEGKNYLAVTLVEDPGADLRRSQKRFLYFYPDEVEPVGFRSAEDDPSLERK